MLTNRRTGDQGWGRERNGRGRRRDEAGKGEERGGRAEKEERSDEKMDGEEEINFMKGRSGGKGNKMERRRRRVNGKKLPPSKVKALGRNGRTGEDGDERKK